MSICASPELDQHMALRRTESAGRVTGRCGLTFRSRRLCAMPKVNPWFDPGINPDSYPGVDALARARAAR